MSAPALKTPDSETQIPDERSVSDDDSKKPIDLNGGKDQGGEERAEQDQEKEEEEEEEEEEGECGFCLFMKGGGCREAFVSWEDCVQEGEKKGEDIVEKCLEVTAALKKCMDAHADYYEPILRAEKAVEDMAGKELEKEKAAKDSGSIVDEKVTDN